MKRYIKQIVLPLIVLLLSTIFYHVNAAEATVTGTCGETLTWTLQNGVLTISGSGPMYDYSSSDAKPWCQIDNPVNEIIIEEGVTSIGQSAFCDLPSIIAVQIPQSVEQIGNFAFSRCTSLQRITIPGTIKILGSNLFYGCTSLSDVTICEGITSIEYGMFDKCTSLSSITFPSTLESINRRAFAGCSLQSVLIPPNVLFIDHDAFSECKKLLTVRFTGDVPEDTRAFFDLTIMGYYPANNETWSESGLPNLGGTIIWQGVSDPATVEVPTGNDLYGVCGDNLRWTLRDGILTISGTGKMTLVPWSGYANEITEVILEPGITELALKAFYDCKKLTDIKIPDSVTHIGSSAFSSCLNLKTVIIPNSVIHISNSAFSSCSSLESVTLPEYISSLESYVFAWCHSLKEITFSSGITSIGEKAFLECTNLRQIIIPDTVESIGESAFERCSSLESVTIGNSVKSISRYAFLRTAITEIIIPPSVEALSGAFLNCANLNTIIFEGDAPQLRGSAFGNVTAFAYFPNGNETWTQNILGSFGGKLTWIEGIPSEDKICGDNLSWSLSNGVLTISGTGKMYDYSSRVYAPWRGNSEEITKIVISDGVTRIGNLAFSHCKNAQEIVIPDSVSTIGNQAFLRCESVKSITIPDTVPVLDEFVFSNCASLTSLTIPSSVTLVDVCAFHYCTALKDIIFLGDAPEFNKSAFSCVEANVWYPAGNSTWTEVIKETYQGQITWYARSESNQEEHPSPEITPTNPPESAPTGTPESAPTDSPEPVPTDSPEPAPTTPTESTPTVAVPPTIETSIETEPSGNSPSVNVTVPDITETLAAEDTTSTDETTMPVVTDPKKETILPETTEKPQKATTFSAWWILIGAALLLITYIILVVVFLKKRRR